MPNDYYNQLENGIIALLNIIKEYKNKDSIEIEIRLGQIESGSFRPGLGSKIFYDKICTILDTNKNWKDVIKTQTEEIVNNGHKKITYKNCKKINKHIYIKKEKLKTIDLTYENTPYDLRMCVSTEIESTEKFKIGIIRKKDRISYVHNDYRIDITKVIQIDNTVESEIYELEIELLNLDSEISDKYRAHSALLLIHDIINMCESIIPESKLKIIK